MQVIAETRNTVNETKNATRHAEINAVDVVEALGQNILWFMDYIHLLTLPDSRDRYFSQAAGSNPDLLSGSRIVFRIQILFCLF